MIPASFNLANKTALITGAGSASGIGFACAVALGELGAKVIVTSTTNRIYDRVNELKDLGFEGKGESCSDWLLL